VVVLSGSGIPRIHFFEKAGFWGVFAVDRNTVEHYRPFTVLRADYGNNAD
jgi:hypothetical protein